MAVVQFLEYRRHDEARTQANNAIMALLAGAHLASHTLQLTEGSAALLPEIFPQVPHIRRFNLRTPVARELLEDAELHLGAMAVPYILAIHEDFVVTCLSMLGDNRRVDAAAMHDRLQLAVPTIKWGPHLAGFHAARILRNCTIHSGGELSAKQFAELQKCVDAAGDVEWRSHTKRSTLKLKVGDRVTFAHGELVATLAATKRIAEAINLGMQTALSRTAWADHLVADIRATEPKLLADERRLRKCAGYARHLYGALKLTEAEIAHALKRAGNH